MSDDASVSGPPKAVYGPMKWVNEQRAKVVERNLKKRNINCQYVPSRQEALSLLLEMIPEGASVGAGNSTTLVEIGLSRELKKRNKNKLIFPYDLDDSGSWVSKEKFDTLAMHRECLNCDVFLSGVNAVTLDGMLVNLDSLGNRVAPTIFGPKKVILVAGVNKIIKDLDQAMSYVQEVTAPICYRWLHDTQKGIVTPLDDVACVNAGRCVDCRGEHRMCNFWVIIAGNPAARAPGRINVVLIGERLGI